MNDDSKRKRKYTIPEKFKFDEAWELFKNPKVFDDKTMLEKIIIFGKPDENGLK